MAREADPAVVARPRPARIAHVPLADMGGLVAQLLQDDVIVRQAMAVRVARHIVDDAVAARILAGQDRGAVGRAERRGVEGRREHRAFMADAVDVRRLHVGMAADTQFVEPEIVDQHDQEIRFAASRHCFALPCASERSARLTGSARGRLAGRQTARLRFAVTTCSSIDEKDSLHGRIAARGTEGPRYQLVHRRARRGGGAGRLGRRRDQDRGARRRSQPPDHDRLGQLPEGRRSTIRGRWTRATSARSCSTSRSPRRAPRSTGC